MIQLTTGACVKLGEGVVVGESDVLTLCASAELAAALGPDLLYLLLGLLKESLWNHIHTHTTQPLVRSHHLALQRAVVAANLVVNFSARGGNECKKQSGQKI